MLEIVSSIVQVPIASAECLWGPCMHGEQYNQHALHVNDMLCIAETCMRLRVSVGVQSSLSA